MVDDILMQLEYPRKRKGKADGVGEEDIDQIRLSAGPAAKGG